MTDDLVEVLLPRLAKASRAGFNVFDVMRHGTHEKQLSNVFGWLLNEEGTHCLGDLFQRIFVDEVNRNRADHEQLDHRRWVVRQEVNVIADDTGQDISDLTLDSPGQRIVVENYVTSDGHGHSFDHYRRFAQTDGQRGAVVLLCRDADDSLQTDGWESAAVVTYRTLITQLCQRLPGGYPKQHSDAYAFLTQMYRKFVAGRGRMDDTDTLRFITTMCTTGEARRYRDKDIEAAKRKLAEDVAAQAAERFDDGRELLQRIKSKLQAYCRQTLWPQLDATFGPGFVTNVSARWAGIYQWTINLDIDSHTLGQDDSGEALQVIFGPSAWFANEQEVASWRHRVDAASADYSYLFLTARWQHIEQSTVTLQEVLDGQLPPTDHRLHDQIVQLWNTVTPDTAQQGD